MERAAFIMHVKEGQEEEYIRRHQEVWPEILEDMEQAGIHQMSIHMQGRQLFLYMEAESYIKAARYLEQRPDSVRWEEFMAPIMENAGGDSYDPTHPYPDGLPEVFHWQSAGSSGTAAGCG